MRSWRQASAQPDGGITLFKSLGVGLEDAAVASVIYDRAMASGRFPLFDAAGFAATIGKSPHGRIPEC